jgi:hypothetical protein
VPRGEPLGVQHLEAAGHVTRSQVEDREERVRELLRHRGRVARGSDIILFSIQDELKAASDRPTGTGCAAVARAL